MRFPYHPVEDDNIETVGNIQRHVPGPHGEGGLDDEQIFCPSGPLLPYSPLASGVLQILVGLLCAGHGSAEVFLIWCTVSGDVGWELNWFNSYGMPIFSGLLLVLTGSLAVRASRSRELEHVYAFYLVTLVSFLLNLGMMIFILVCKIVMQPTHLSECKAPYTDAVLEMICEQKDEVKTHLSVSVLSAVYCLLGNCLLFLTTVNYFSPVMFGEARLLKQLGICCLPCCFYKPPKSSSSITDLLGSNESSLNLIV